MQKCTYICTHTNIQLKYAPTWVQAKIHIYTWAGFLCTYPHGLHTYVNTHCIHTHPHTYLHTYIHMCSLCTTMCMDKHTSTTHTHIYTQANNHTQKPIMKHPHTHTHTYTHIEMQTIRAENSGVVVSVGPSRRSIQLWQCQYLYTVERILAKSCVLVRIFTTHALAVDKTIKRYKKG